MSKIICEVCGTTYPETATQCPICGTVRPGDVVVTPSAEEEAGGKSGYQYVKGGRFSKANVRKRNKQLQVSRAEVAQEASETTEEKPASNKGLVITAILLLLAIIAVLIYIAVHFLGNWLLPDSGNKKPGITPQESTQQQLDIPCTGITLESSVVELDMAGASVLITAVAEPADTTDVITYTSDNTDVATVSDSGKVTAVGAGQAIITVSCGDQTIQCRVICQITETTEETIPEITEVPTAPSDFRLNREDITFSAKGEIWVLYSGSVDVKQITWTSDDEKIATIKDGKVEAVGPGMTTVYGSYADSKVSCIIRCSFEEDGPISGSGGNITEGGNGQGSQNTVYYISTTVSGGKKCEDITMRASETLTFILVDSNGSKVSGATWRISDNTLFSVDDSGTVSVLKTDPSDYAVLYATYNGETYQCILRSK